MALSIPSITQRCSLRQLSSRVRIPKIFPLHHDLRRTFTSTLPSHSTPDPRLTSLGPLITDSYATLRSHYATPTSPIVLAHGLLGFDELRIAGSLLPGVHYWRGITEALTANGIEVILTSVPPSASIEERAAKLSADIEKKAGGKSVNIVAHSMGGLDARLRWLVWEMVGNKRTFNAVAFYLDIADMLAKEGY
ncbi:hypothetical protein JMJ35_008666 [Cladonia borealis]|uniref:Triacylglycerol lipase n=1 Tax=Cladonia borealis TaxID=184061 RepID=A0AA39V714_9LECA|nr:hypothetical protein JMJ35_008666 [Cladonia borealis]